MTMTTHKIRQFVPADLAPQFGYRRDVSISRFGDGGRDGGIMVYIGNTSCWGFATVREACEYVRETIAAAAGADMMVGR